ncbi:MAG: hypothetical protein NVSMB26_00180 [Beijerinckiaceae bacterium]
MRNLESIRVALAAGSWWVSLKRAANPEYVSPERALEIAEEFENAGCREDADQLRKAARTALRYHSYAEP